MERNRRVLIAYADETARARVRAAARAANLRVCGYAKDAVDAVAKTRRTKPDICLLDLDLPGGGLHAAGEIEGTHPSVSIVVLANSAAAGTSWLRHGSAPRADLLLAS
jgi:DNA-binding NarL/FixJ family response regulator